ncbi:universal stress protein [Chryseolinea sp. H1M3-3]|uniref:universal stress protein n=1 Tax=Chryseolinea sp. H1M3-3 TaxID=3034144 RepID=UPI0023EC090A|nr:universal stress protein [Chryseolinea sp. H1M3-3]
MKKILVPCDFSSTAREAFKFAANMVAKNKGEIYVLYVVDNTYMNNATSELSHTAAFSGVFMQKLEEQLNEKFVLLKNEYASPDATITFKIDIGTLTQSIETYVAEKKIDLIVMGTHGASGLKEFFVGSNTEKIVRYSTVPVVAVPLGSQFDSIDNIVFPVVPTQRANNFIHEVKAIQNFFHAKLQILWINTPHIFKSDDEAMEDLQEFAEHHHFHDYSLNVRNDHSEQEGILRFAREIQAGLIFMPTHSRKGLVHWLTGSITENVVNHVQCPVWTYSIKD